MAMNDTVPSQSPRIGSSGTGRPDPALGDPIRIARVVCIFAVIFVHVNPGISDFDPSGQGVRPFDWLRLEIVNSFGRASIALLSVISGYLAVFSLRKAGYGGFARKKVMSLLVPLAIWSAAMVALAFLGDQVRPGYAAATLGEPVSLLRLPDWLIGLTAPPANVPLYFLRDIFVCALLTPLLVSVWRRGWRAFLLLVAALYALGHLSPLFLTPNLLAFYAIGVAIALNGRVPQVPASAALVSLVAMLAIGAWVSVLQVGYLRAAPNAAHAAPAIVEFWLTLIRLPAAVLFWWLSVRLARSAAGPRLAQFEPFIFFAFCSHMIVLTLMWFAWQQVFGGYYDAAYPVFFFLSPVAVLLIARMAVPVLGKLMPPVFRLINGGRGFARPPQAQTAATRS
jgi:fucose 4-O-acetylase-like acetyltransferase